MGSQASQASKSGDPATPPAAAAAATAATADNDKKAGSGITPKIIGTIFCGLIALALYITSFVYTSKALGGGTERNTAIREALSGIIAPGIIAGFFLFIGIALFILQTDNIKVIYGLLFLSVSSFTMSYVAIAVSAIQR